MTMDGMRRITVSVTQQNSDLAIDATEVADKYKKKEINIGTSCNVLRENRMDVPIRTPPTTQRHRGARSFFLCLVAKKRYPTNLCNFSTFSRITLEEHVW